MKTTTVGNRRRGPDAEQGLRPGRQAPVGQHFGKDGAWSIHFTRRECTCVENRFGTTNEDRPEYYRDLPGQHHAVKCPMYE